MQKVREAERAQVIEAYQNRVGEMVTGVVKRLETRQHHPRSRRQRGGRSSTARTSSRARIVRPGDRLRGYLKDVRPEARGPQLVRRAVLRPYLMVHLFTLEVSGDRPKG